MTDNNGTYVSRYDDNQIFGYNIFEQPIQVPSLQSSSTLQLNAPDGLILSNGVGANGQILVSQGINNPPQWRTVSGASTTLSALVAQNSSCGDLPLTQCSGIESTNAFNLVANDGLNVGNGVGTIGQVLTSNGSAEPTWTSVSGSSKTLGELVTENPSCNDLPLTHCTGIDSTTTLELVAPDGLVINGGVGTNDQVLVSQGVGLTPIWKTILETQTLTSILDTNTSAGFNPITDIIGIESQSQLTMVAPTGIQLNNTVGTSGQYLGSNGTAQPTWKTLPTTTLSGIIAESSSCGNQGLTDIPSVTSANTFSITAPQGLSVGGSVGVAGQILTSNGGSAPATWTTPVSNSTTLSGLIAQSSDCGNQNFTNCAGVQSNNYINLVAPSGIRLANTEGSQGQVLTSNGTAQPTWQTISSGTSTLAQLVASNSSCGDASLTQCTGISSGTTLSLTAPSGLRLNNSVGTTNQVLSSNGAGQPTWKTVSVNPTLAQVLVNGSDANGNIIQNLAAISSNTSLSLVAGSTAGSFMIFTAPFGLKLNGGVGTSGQYFGSLGGSQPQWTTLPTFSQILDINASAGGKTITGVVGIQSTNSLTLTAPSGINLNNNVTSSSAWTCGSLASSGAISSSGNITATGNLTGTTVTGSTNVFTPLLNSTTISNSGTTNTGTLICSSSAFCDSTLSVTGTATVGNLTTAGTIGCGGLLTGNTMSFTRYGNQAVGTVTGNNIWTNSTFNYDFPLTYSNTKIVRVLGDNTFDYIANYDNGVRPFPNTVNPLPDGLVVSCLNSDTFCSVILPLPTNGQKVFINNFTRFSGTNPTARTGAAMYLKSASSPMFCKTSNSSTYTVKNANVNCTFYNGATAECVACGTYWLVTVNDYFE